MKNTLIAGIIAAASLTACSTVSSLMQSTFPYNSSYIVTAGSPAQTQLSGIGAGFSINQLVGVSNNVQDIKISNATASVTSGAQGMGVFRSVNVYLSAGGNEVLVASRDNIADNIGNTLALDINASQSLDNIMKSGQTIQQKVVYVLKSSPTTDLTVKTSLSFNSTPISK